MSVGSPGVAVYSQAASISAGNGLYSYGADSAFPRSVHNASNYWVDIVFRPRGSKTTVSIFPAKSLPATPTVDDPNPVELGVRFQTSLAGTITGIRFYKGLKNTNTHVGNLWTATGALLATATFISETGDGWQQVDFARPVHISANTPYVASYHTSAGFYSADSGYYASCRRSRLLTASGPTPCVATNATPGGRSGSDSIATASRAGDLPNTLCIGGSKYTLDDHDWFDKDTILSVSDDWPPSGGAEWSNRYQWGRNNFGLIGTDWSWHPGIAELAQDRRQYSASLPPVASLVRGAGVKLVSYEQPVAIRSQAGNLDRYFSGLLSNAKSYTEGYWVYSAQLPGGDGWWPGLWELSESGGNYYELDNLEQWGPGIAGPNVASQTEQGAPELHEHTVVPTMNSAQHTYGALVTAGYIGFYIDGVPTTKQFTRYQRSALDPIMNLQVCSDTSFCKPPPAPGATAQMIVRYYAHFSPAASPAPCFPSDLAKPAPQR